MLLCTADHAQLEQHQRSCGNPKAKGGVYGVGLGLRVQFSEFRVQGRK